MTYLSIPLYLLLDTRPDLKLQGSSYNLHILAENGETMCGWLLHKVADRLVQATATTLVRKPEICKRCHVQYQIKSALTPDNFPIQRAGGYVESTAVQRSQDTAQDLAWPDDEP